MKNLMHIKEQKEINGENIHIKSMDRKKLNGYIDESDLY